MGFNKKITINSPLIVGTGLVVLDIIINNGNKTPIFNVGGTCANVLAGLSFFGWKSITVARCGLDTAGDILLQDIQRNGMDTDFIFREDMVKTPRIIEKLQSNGQSAKHKFLLRCPSCKAYLPRFRSPRLDSLDKIFFRYSAPDVYFFDRITPSSLKLAKIYRKSGALIFFEPNNLKYDDKLEEAIRLSHVLKYAGKELNEKSNENNNDELIKRITSFCPALVIKTIGKFGLLYKFSNDKQWRSQEGVKPVEIIDSCGAGDWCTSSFIFGLFEASKKNKVKLLDSLMDNNSVKSSLRFAQKVASISLSFIGARGLSNSMTRERFFTKYKSIFQDISSIDFLPSKRTYVDDIKSNIKIGTEDCNVCLMKE